MKMYKLVLKMEYLGMGITEIVATPKRRFQRIGWAFEYQDYLNKMSYVLLKYWWDAHKEQLYIANYNESINVLELFKKHIPEYIKKYICDTEIEYIYNKCVYIIWSYYGTCDVLIKDITEDIVEEDV